jgi:hypothetical protein
MQEEASQGVGRSALHAARKAKPITLALRIGRG